MTSHRDSERPRKEVHPGRGPWRCTYTGRKFFPFDPRPEEVDLDDIAVSLGNICRWTGHVSRFYSVAEHSLRCARMASTPRTALFALLHDSHEAYLGDIASPVKSVTRFAVEPFGRMFQEPAMVEMEIDAAIRDALRIPQPGKEESAAVAAIDRTMLHAEMHELMPAAMRAAMGYDPSIAAQGLAEWGMTPSLSPDGARRAFRAEYLRLAATLGLEPRL